MSASGKADSCWSSINNNFTDKTQFQGSAKKTSTTIERSFAPSPMETIYSSRSRIRWTWDSLVDGEYPGERRQNSCMDTVPRKQTMHCRTAERLRQSDNKKRRVSLKQ